MRAVASPFRICSCGPSMTTSEYKTRPCFGRQIIMAVVIACLCFSAGEGLRLRPSPVSGLEEAEATNPQLHASASNEISTKYGSLIVPTRPLKRCKQQVVDYGNPPSQSSRELTAHPLLLPVTGEAEDIVSLLLISLTTSRAPPFIS